MSENDNTPPEQPAIPGAMQHLAFQMQIVQTAQNIARESFLALTSVEGQVQAANELAAQTLNIIAPDGGLRVITMAATASVVASVVAGIIRTDLEIGGKSVPSDALIMAINMMAQQLIASHQQQMQAQAQALNDAVEADPNRAN